MSSWSAARPAGKDSIDHAPGSYDDLANAVAGAFDVIAAQPKLYLHLGSWGSPVRQVGGEDEAIDAAEWGCSREKCRTWQLAFLDREG